MLDIRRGLAESVTDPGGNVTATNYDPVGRTTKVFRPGDALTAPSYQFTYTVNHTALSKVTSAVRATSSKVVTSYALVDSFGRTRETQTLPASGTGRLVSQTAYDDRGLVTMASAPYVATGTPGSGLTNVAAPPNNTLTWYDELQRPVASILRNASTVVSVGTTAYTGLVAQATSPEGRKRAQTWDVRGHVVSVEQQYRNTASHYATTSFTWDRNDQLTQITDDDGNHTTNTFDHLGRRVASDDPDAGAWSYRYDRDSNLIGSTDAKGNSTFTNLDDLGRPTARYLGTDVKGTKVAEWDYEDGANVNKGRLLSSSTFDGADTYTQTTNAWDALGRPTSQTTTIPASAGTGLAGSYTATASQDLMGNPLTQTMPAAGDLPAETLTYAYDAKERPTTLTSSLSMTYVSATGFRPDGLLQSRTYGNDANKVTRLYAYDAATLRLSTIAAAFASGGTFQNDSYAYDLDGNVAKITDNATGGAAQQQCFNYDSQNRLYQAWTSGTTVDCSTIANASATAGPDPYRLTFTHDELDNRLTATTGFTNPVTRTYHYDGTGGAGPHAVTSIDSGVAGVGADSFGYDANGAMVSRSTPAGSTAYSWDAQHELTAVAVGSDTTGSVFWADGTRVLRRTPDGATTLYLGGQEVTRAPGGAVTAVRYYGSGGATVAMRRASGVRWLLADGQGSAQITVAAGTTTVQRQRHLPYGEARGVDNVLATDRDYIGKVKDDSTGLVQMGARPYDPALGKFLAVDPLSSPTNPQTLNGYAYALDNPTSYSDPSGLRVPADGNSGYNGAPVHDPRPGYTGPSGSGSLGSFSSGSSVATLGGPSGLRGSASVSHANNYLIDEVAIPFRKGAVDATWGAVSSIARHPMASIEAMQRRSNPVSLLFEEAGITRRHGLREAVRWHFMPLVDINDCDEFSWSHCLAHTAGALAATIAVAKAGGKLADAGGAAEGSAEGAAVEAGEAATEAEAAVGDLAGSCHSFDKRTEVLMADGTRKEIGDVKIGDRVRTTDPETGETVVRLVIALHVNQDTDLTDLTVRGARGPDSTIHTTQHHRFWGETRNTWVDASDLMVGDRLHDLDGSIVTVAGVLSRTGLQTMYDLTVDGVHTYYVEAGDDSVLVHNCPMGWKGFSDHALKRLADRGVTPAQAEEVLQQPVGSYWHEGMWKEGFYDNSSKIFIGQGPDGGITTVMTNVSKAYVKRLLAAGGP